jgi:hypothetical protein
VQTLLYQLIKLKHDKASSCPKHKCAACCLSKTGRSSTPTTTVVDTSDWNLNNDVPNLGDIVHLDQYMSGLSGHLHHALGKEKHKARFTGGTISVDWKTDFIRHNHQVSLRVGETLKSKNAFEKGAAPFGVNTRTFKADNVPFSSVKFKIDIANKEQDITFSGVGAHHQNGG